MMQVMLEHRLEGCEEVGPEGIWGRVFQAKDATRAKALRQDCVWRV